MRHHCFLEDILWHSEPLENVLNDHLKSLFNYLGVFPTHLLVFIIFTRLLEFSSNFNCLLIKITRQEFVPFQARFLNGHESIKWNHVFSLKYLRSIFYQVVLVQILVDLRIVRLLILRVSDSSIKFSIFSSLLNPFLYLIKIWRPPISLTCLCPLPPTAPFNRIPHI